MDPIPASALIVGRPGILLVSARCRTGDKGMLNPVVRQGRANYTTLEAVTDGAPVLAGTFYILDLPASVLFDTGASHSFISTKCIKKHGFQIEQSGYKFLITTPGGRVTAT